MTRQEQSTLTSPLPMLSLDNMTSEHLRKPDTYGFFAVNRVITPNIVSMESRAYQRILIHASTYDDVDELLEGLNVAADKGCGHDVTILESPLRLAFLNSAISVARYLMTNSDV